MTLNKSGQSMKNVADYYDNSRPELATLIPEDVHHVLEIGCGLGSFRKNITTNCEYWGVEPVDAVAERASDNLDYVLCGKFEEVQDQIPDAYFDLIVCNDVIEHMVDADSFLKLIKSKMNPNRSFIIGSVPNVRYVENLFNLLVNKDWKYMSWGVLDNTHLRFFTQRSLRRTFVENGYLVDLIGGINPVPFITKSPWYIFKSIGARVLCYLFGSDATYSQFAFRVSPNEKNGRDQSDLSPKNRLPG